MATTQLEKVSVKALSKFGFQDSKGEYVNWSKFVKDEDKINVVPGRTFNMELYISDSGKKYVNKVLQMVETADVPAPIKMVKSNSKVAPLVTVADKPMTREDWDSKDRRISRQGVIQAAVQAVASQSTLEDLFTNAEKLANQMLSFVQEK